MVRKALKAFQNLNFRAQENKEVQNSRSNNPKAAKIKIQKVLRIGQNFQGPLRIRVNK